MKQQTINKLTRKVNNAKFNIKKQSPVILMTLGIVGGIGSAVLASKATLKARDILEETAKDVETIQEVSQKRIEGTLKYEYTKEDELNDKLIVYTQSIIKLARVYAPSFILGGMSIACILNSHRIISKRNVALAAAYGTVDKAFKDYRGRVVDRFGEAIDRELKHNLKIKEFEHCETDEAGNEIKTTENIFVANPSDVSEYARFFEQYTVDSRGNKIINPNWCPSNEHNLVFLKQTERWFNDRLQIVGRVFLNEVYDALGLPQSKAGQIVGWVYDENNPNVDNFIDFGLYKDNLSYSDFVNGFDPAILLDFNVDGNIWDLM